MSKGNLTVRKVATAAPGKHWDGAGLQLVVSKSGSLRLRPRLEAGQEPMGPEYGQ